MVQCPVCGNETDTDSPLCRFCGGDLLRKSGDSRQTVILHRRINLEQGRPLVETALQRLKNELALAASLNIKVITLIHGYGSSGKGGKIREECRKILEDLVHHRRLRAVIPGERFHRRTGAGKALLRQFPQLDRETAAALNNPGVTIVVL